MYMNSLNQQMIFEKRLVNVSERRFNPAHLKKLDDPKRRQLLPLDQTLSLLTIQGKKHVLDLGAGTGYFTIPAARATDGTVYALDIEQKMLSVLRDRVTSQGLTNVQLIEGPIEDVPMEDEVVDYVIASMVLHEVEPLSKGLQEVGRLLKKGGTCLCVEWEKVETDQGPPLNHRIHSKTMKDKLEQFGFKNICISFPSPEIYTITFEK